MIGQDPPIPDDFDGKYQIERFWSERGFKYRRDGKDKKGTKYTVWGKSGTKGTNGGNGGDGGLNPSDGIFHLFCLNCKPKFDIKKRGMAGISKR